MNEEMKDSEGAFGAAGSPPSAPVSQEQTNLMSDHMTVVSGDDETFQDIFRDFSDMASHDPEKLSRPHFNRVGDKAETK